MKILLFGTTYVDTPEKCAIQKMWFKMAEAERNRGCHALVVDSCSPRMAYVPRSVAYYTFEDNIGHLSRGGRDGWGRAFCHGLQWAIDREYDYAVHVECDSLLKLSVVDIAEEMALSGDDVCTIHVSSWPQVMETGLMAFSVEWLRDTNFVAAYDWENRARYPEPEKVVGAIVDKSASFMPWRGMRDDFHELTVENLSDRNLDWLTHAPLPVMEEFAR